MGPPVPFPPDVHAWLLNTFRTCNERVSSVLTRVPTTYETTLDMTFIEHFATISAPVQFPSRWTVQISTHFLGGGRHFGPDGPRWEIADIGFLVLFRQGGKLIRSKVALLQSKRLYPDEIEWEEDNPVDYWYGFGRLYQPDEDWAAVTAPRSFSFTPQSRYKALVTGVQQYEAIAQYEQRRNVPVYYMLYHPWRVPHTMTYPLTAERTVGGSCDVGCRVVPAQDLRAAMRNKAAGQSPAYDELRRTLGGTFAAPENQGGWRLEHFVVDLLLDCQAGYLADSSNDGGLNYIFNRRSGPISAALAVTIDAP